MIMNSLSTYFKTMILVLIINLIGEFIILNVQDGYQRVNYDAFVQELDSVSDIYYNGVTDYVYYNEYSDGDFISKYFNRKVVRYDSFLELSEITAGHGIHFVNCLDPVWYAWNKIYNLVLTIIMIVEVFNVIVFEKKC